MQRRLSVVLVAIAALSLALFVHTRRLPALASSEGALVDAQFRLTLLVLGALFALAHAALACVLWRRSRTADTAMRGSVRAEWMFITFALCTLGLLGITGSRALASVRNYAQRDTIELEVTGMQFQWYFRYPGPDGAFGSTRPELIDASVGNPLGVDPADPLGADDVVSAVAVVPQGHTIELTLHAQDVIHSFYVPAMRFKQDAVPGMTTHMRFTPDRIGTYEVACAELCGLGHYRMNTQLRVVSEREYQQWLREHARGSR